MSLILETEKENDKGESRDSHEKYIVERRPRKGWEGIIFTKKCVSLTRIERDTCTPVFITALFTIARTWKQPKCPSADKWIRKLWYIYTMEYSVQFSSVQSLSCVGLFATP